MKAALLVSVLALTSASGFLELVPEASNVGDNCNTALNEYTVGTFVLTPWPPARNENVTLSMTGTFDDAETLDALVVNVNYQKVPFYQLVLPRSGKYNKGQAYKDGYTAFFPTIAPSGSYAVMLQLRNSANAYINCWEVTFTL
jgi:hypothetical protein